MDRFEAHSRHCRSCRQAHRRFVRWRPRLLALAVGLPLLALLQPALLPAALAVAAVLALLARQCALWQRGLEQGSGQPPRNRS